jgi:predicted ferric reductase
MILFALTQKATWYLARSGGMVAWVLCSASILWGLLLSTRLIRRRGAPAWILDMHRFLGTLSIIFTVLHLSGLFFDTYQPFTFADLLIPMHAKWKSGAVAWGIIAFYLLAAIQISSWLMRKMSRKVWHAIHLGSFGLFVFATLHSFLAGTDRHNMLVQWVALTGGTLVLFMTVFRVLSPRSGRKTPRSATATG